MLKVLVAAHDHYSRIRNEFEDKIREVFAENNVTVKDVVFQRNGFEVVCVKGVYSYAVLGNIDNAFEDLDLSFEFYDNDVVFKFKSIYTKV